MSTGHILAIPDGVAVRTVSVTAGPLAVVDAVPERAAQGRPPALLVPGYTGSKEDFAPLLRPLADTGRRIVAYDQRGQHASPGPDDPAAYEVDALAAELLELVDALDLASDGGGLHVVGHSFGGLVARAAVLARPAAFRSITLLDSGPAAIDGARAERIRALRPVLDAHGQDAVWNAMAQLAEADGAPPVAPEVGAFLRERFFASSAAGLRAMGEQLLSEPDRVAELAAIGLPTLVAYGAADDAWSPAAQADMSARLGATRRVIAGAGHSPNVDTPEQLVTVLVDYWADIDSRAAGDGGE